ncbi:tripartite tricarboxylate transporter permease [bacterium]|nr:tripartite tricarboxylate transporter permease [bacterium]
MISFLTVLIYTVLGSLTGALLSLIPSLHIYNVAGFALLIWHASQSLIPQIAVAPFFISLVVAFSFINTIPMTFVGAPDESATVTILPGTKMMMSGAGYEAAVLTGTGSLIGLFMLIAMTPFFFYLFPTIHLIVSPHMHWILMLVMIYMLMSEWPKGCGMGKTVLQRFLNAWGNIFAGLLTFGLAGLLGLIITSKSPISHEMGFQNIMPVFVGLFAIPSIIQNLLSNEKIPDQHIAESINIDARTAGISAYQGVIGGMIAAYLPAVTAGIGGIIAGHATAQRGDKLFIISGGVSKIIYYVGAFLFLFIITPLSPNGLGKGGLNIILKPVLTPEKGDFFVILSVILVSGCLSFLMLLHMSKWVLAFLKVVDYRQIYIASLILMFVIVGGLTGFMGLMVMIVGTFVGMIPVFFHSRRSNCMAVLLIPICLNMAGYGDVVMEFLGLL